MTETSLNKEPLRKTHPLMAGSGGSQGFPVMALLMASSAVMPWAAAVSR